MLVFGQIGNGLEPFFILRTGKKHVPDTAGQEIEKDADQFTGMNGPPKGRKTDLEADCDAVFAAFAGCAGEDFRSRRTDGHEPAFSGAFGFKVKLSDLTAKLPHQIVLKCSLFPGLVKEGSRKPGFCVRDLDAYLGGSGERISLDMVNG